MRLEPAELPSPAPEGDRPRTGHEIEDDMTERAVAPALRVEGDVRVRRGRAGCRCINDPGADADLLQVRGRDRAEGTREPRVLGALFRHVESSAAPGVLPVVVVARVSGS